MFGLPLGRCGVNEGGDGRQDGGAISLPSAPRGCGDDAVVAGRSTACVRGHPAGPRRGQDGGRRRGGVAERSRTWQWAGAPRATLRRVCGMLRRACLLRVGTQEKRLVMVRQGVRGRGHALDRRAARWFLIWVIVVEGGVRGRGTRRRRAGCVQAEPVKKLERYGDVCGGRVPWGPGRRGRGVSGPGGEVVPRV
jgi:hypothetical protein